MKKLIKPAEGEKEKGKKKESKIIKIIFTFIFFIIIIFFFSFNNGFSSNNKENKNTYTELLTNKIVNFDSYPLKFSDMDLTLKFVFLEKESPFKEYRINYSYIINIFKDLLLIQNNGLRSYFGDFIQRNKELYKVNYTDLNEFYYSEQRIKVILYDEKYLIFKRVFDLGKVPTNEEIKNFIKISNLEFKNSLEYYIYFITKLLKNIDRINSFYDIYSSELSKIYENIHLNELTNLLCITFNIKNKEYLKFYIDLIPEIYSLTNPIPTVTAGQLDVKEYKNVLISNNKISNYIAFNLDILPNKYLLTKYFIEHVIYYLQSNSSWFTNLLDGEKINKKIELNDLSFSSLNKFFNEFKNIKKENIFEIDAKFSLIYTLNNLRVLFPEIYDEIISDFYKSYLGTDDDLNFIAKKYEIDYVKQNFTDEIYNYLLIKYSDFCRKKGYDFPVLYCKGADVLIGISDFDKESNPNNKNLKLVTENLYEFIIKEIYQNRIETIKDINRASKYFGLSFKGLYYSGTSNLDIIDIDSTYEN